jgi:hypothetical protein
MDFIDNTGKPPSPSDMAEAEAVIRSAMTQEMPKVMVASPGLAVQLPNILRCLRRNKALLALTELQAFQMAHTDKTSEATGTKTQGDRIDQLLREIEDLHEEIEALKNQRRWELYLVMTKEFSSGGQQVEDDYVEPLESFARRVDTQAKQYVNAVLPK